MAIKFVLCTKHLFHVNESTIVRTVDSPIQKSTTAITHPSNGTARLQGKLLYVIAILTELVINPLLCFSI